MNQEYMVNVIISSWRMKMATGISRSGNFRVLTAEIVRYGLTGACESRPYMRVVLLPFHRHEFIGLPTGDYLAILTWYISANGIRNKRRRKCFNTIRLFPSSTRHKDPRNPYVNSAPPNA
jgi:hypothetical protein